MGAMGCRRRAAAGPSGASPGRVAHPKAEQIRDLWLTAVQEEDAAAAGFCARLCEGLRGAEAFANCDGLDAFLAVAMGESMKEDAQGKGGLMVALAQALMADMSDFKVAIFETIAAAAFWPSLKGRVAGSGVLGVVTATLLSPRHPPQVRALMVRLCGLLAADSPEAAKIGTEQRRAEFAKLQGQLISSGALKAIVSMLSPASHASLVSASALAVASLGGAGSGAAARLALAEAQAVPALVSYLEVVLGSSDPLVADEDCDTSKLLTDVMTALCSLAEFPAAAPGPGAE